MLILPAIDLLEGRCVRLRQGRFDQSTVYSDDPVAVARAFVEMGADALHIVDLEGARLGKSTNLEWIFRIRRAVPVPIQVGGGIRAYALAHRLFAAGIDRIVLGTAAVQDPRLLSRLLKDFDSDRVAAALDIEDGDLAIEGWEMRSDRRLDDVLIELQSLGLRWAMCTDVARDGVLMGPGLEVARRVIDAGFNVIIAGGIATVHDVARVCESGAAGCIIGRALYSGKLSLREALETARAH